MTLGVFIDGAAGTTGLEIRERLAGRDDLTLLALPGERRKDPAARREALNDADLVVLCLPDEAAREAVALINNPRTRVIDASTAHRTHPEFVYGFPEMGEGGHARVASAVRLSNPGCYSTGFIALLEPLVRAGLVPTDWPATVNAVSGYSGGGKAMIEEYEAGRAGTAFRAYALGLAHKHVPEMQLRAGLAYPPLFSPAVANTMRGMIVEVPLNFAGRGVSADDVRAVLAEAYAGSPIVALPEQEGDLIPIERCAGSDRLDLFVFGNAAGQLRLVAALDNLGKGAAGAAVQSLNIMAGVDETTGLRL